MNFSFCLVLHHVFFLVLRPGSQDLSGCSLRSFGGLRFRRDSRFPVSGAWALRFVALLVAVCGFYLFGFLIRDHPSSFSRRGKLARHFVLSLVRFGRHLALLHVGAFFGCTYLLLLRRSLWCPIAILGDRFSRQDDWRVSGGWTEFGAWPPRGGGRARLAARSCGYFQLSDGFGFGLGPVLTVLRTSATSAATTLASTPPARSSRRVPIFA